jgi:hypothetical protein
MSENRWGYLYNSNSEQLRLYKLIYNLTISNPGLKAVSSNASRGWTVRYFGGDDQGFLKEGARLIQCPMAPMALFNSPTIFLSSHLRSMGTWTFFYSHPSEEIWTLSKNLYKIYNMKKFENRYTNANLTTFTAPKYNSDLTFFKINSLFFLLPIKTGTLKDFLVIILPFGRQRTVISIELLNWGIWDGQGLVHALSVVVSRMSHSRPATHAYIPCYVPPCDMGYEYDLCAMEPAYIRHRTSRYQGRFKAHCCADAPSCCAPPPLGPRSHCCS